MPVDSLQPLLAPVVLISACGLMIMALNARAISAKARIRQFHFERLRITEAAAGRLRPTPTQLLRYEGVGNQSNNLLSRLRLMRSSLASMVLCVVLMLVSSLLIGLAGIQAKGLFDDLAVVAFVGGIFSMLLGSVLFLLELRISLREIEYEHERIMALKLTEPDPSSVP